MGSFLRGATGTGNSFAAAQAPVQGQNFQPLLAGSQSQFNQAYGNQGSLAQTLQAQANGSGPNPAQLQFQQNTDNAIKQNTGMVASQKGINPELAQRQAAQNAAGMSQTAAGQSAQMQAGQQLGAEQALGGVYGQQANESNSMQSTLQNALAAYNNANVGMTSNQNMTNAGVAAQNSATGSGLVGGLFSGGGSLLSLAHGGVVPDTMPKQSLNMAPTQNFDDGGAVLGSWGYNLQPNTGGGGGGSDMANQYIQSGGQSLSNGESGLGKGAAKYFKGAEEAPTYEGTATDWSLGGGLAGGAGDAGGLTGAGAAAGDAAAVGGGASDAGLLALAAAHGGQIPDHFHSMAKIYHPDFSQKMKPKSFTKGGDVPGKAPFKGDNYKNDVVDAKLTPGEVVIDKETLQDNGPVGKAARMVAHAIADKNKSSGNPMSDFHEALKGAIKNRRAK